jgi:hypothetical protein
MIETMKQARKQAEQAPKFVLHLENFGLYLSAKQGLSGCNLTPNIAEAMQFSEGFDNPQTKIGIWSAAASRLMNTKVVFNVEPIINN